MERKTENLEAHVLLIMQLASGCDLELLNKIVKQYADANSRYQAIGILDGHAYLSKSADKDARYKRLFALRHFIQTVHETNKDIIREEE